MKEIIILILVTTFLGCKNEPIYKDSFPEVLEQNERFTLKIYKLFKSNNVERLDSYRLSLSDYEEILEWSDESSDIIDQLKNNYNHPSTETLAQVNELLIDVNNKNLDLDSFKNKITVDVFSDSGNISFRSSIVLKNKDESASYRFWVMSRLDRNGDFKFTHINII